MKKYHNEHVGNKSPGLNGTLIDSTYVLGIKHNMFRKKKSLFIDEMTYPQKPSS